jgi:RNA polymerase sigma factor (sigma-70 family)
MIQATENAGSRKSRGDCPAFLARLCETERLVYHGIPEDVEYVWDQSFSRAGVERELFGPDAQVDVPPWIDRSQPMDEPSDTVIRPNVLGHDRTRILFLRYNYARYRLSELAAAQRARSTAARARQMVRWRLATRQSRASLVQANLALVLAMAKHARMDAVEFADLISEGNMALLRSIDKFDVSRGFRFSTYACRAILKSFSRLAGKVCQYRKRFPVEFDPALEPSDYMDQRHEAQRADSVDIVRDVLAHNRAQLTDIERRIVSDRFGIQSRDKGLTLSQVGSHIGLTNERIRQIQKRALAKIRTAVNDLVAGFRPMSRPEERHAHA